MKLLQILHLKVMKKNPSSLKDGPILASFYCCYHRCKMMPHKQRLRLFCLKDAIISDKYTRVYIISENRCILKFPIIWDLVFKLKM